MNIPRLIACIYVNMRKRNKMCTDNHDHSKYNTLNLFFYDPYLNVDKNWRIKKNLLIIRFKTITKTDFIFIIECAHMYLVIPYWHPRSNLKIVVPKSYGHLLKGQSFIDCVSCWRIRSFGWLLLNLFLLCTLGHIVGTLQSKNPILWFVLLVFPTMLMNSRTSILTFMGSVEFSLDGKINLRVFLGSLSFKINYSHLGSCRASALSCFGFLSWYVPWDPTLSYMYFSPHDTKLKWTKDVCVEELSDGSWVVPWSWMSWDTANTSPPLMMMVSFWNRIKSVKFLPNLYSIL